MTAAEYLRSLAFDMAENFGSLGPQCDALRACADLVEAVTPRPSMEIEHHVGHTSNCRVCKALAAIESAYAKAVEALNSIGNNTCCAACQEAALVANAALRSLPKVPK